MHSTLSSSNFPAGEVGGVNPQEALFNIKKRCQERKEGRNSSLKTALVLQGGGMRGVFGAGVCCALEELGYREGFDEVYGVSAGALNGAYFLSGQAAYGTTIYYQDINNRKFINFLRIKKIMDIDFLINVIKKIKPLNLRKIEKSPTPLNVVLTRVSDGKACVFKSTFYMKDILDILKATAAMPLIYDIPVKIGDFYYLDGGISCPIPICEAIEDGCTDILVVLTRPKGYKPEFSKTFFDFYVRARIKRYGERFYRIFLERSKIYRERLSIINGEKKVGRKVNILAIFPGTSFRVKRTTKRKALLKAAAIEGGIKTLRIFGREDFHPLEVLRFLNT
ncbi:patatin family protein [Candidatus Aerophobetes bacterium]|nr:patatin family protein [Candidatus Aerophobetes bacterium]